MKIILASASPRRKELLRQIGLDFQAVSPGVDEELRSGDFQGEVKRIAAEKARWAKEQGWKGLIIAVDTLVLHEGKVMGKPSNEKEARDFLARLRGNTHEVLSGVAVLRTEDDTLLNQCEATKVTFNDISDEQIDSYIATGEPRDKAGAYGIQGKAAIFIAKIEGDYYNVVGLPLTALSAMLRELGIDITTEWRKTTTP